MVYRLHAFVISVVTLSKLGPTEFIGSNENDDETKDATSSGRLYFSIITTVISKFPASHQFVSFRLTSSSSLFHYSLYRRRPSIDKVYLNQFAHLSLRR